MNVYVPEFWLSTTEGLHVPVIPLILVSGNTGAVVPAQKGGTGVNVGTNMGSDKITPVKRLVVTLLNNSEKLA